MNVSLSSDIFLCGWLGLKHQLTNYISKLQFEQLLTEWHYDSDKQAVQFSG